MQQASWSESQEVKWKFLLAGLSNQIGGGCTNPMDVVKIRMQLDGELAKKGQPRQYPSFPAGLRKIYAEEGVRGLWRGLPASLLREGSYSTIRMGAYEPIKDAMGFSDRGDTPLWVKVAAGACSGMFGSALATPTDLIKVRMQADCSRPPEPPRYSGLTNAISSIIRKEGWSALYTGGVPTVQRAMLLTGSQVPAYDHTKHSIQNAGLMAEGPMLHVTCSMVAGFVAAFVTSPVDVIKTRMMNAEKAVGGGKKYTSTLDCFRQSVRAEGALGLYKGFFPNWLRIGPHTVITFFVMEQLRAAVGLAPI